LAVVLGTHLAHFLSVPRLPLAICTAALLCACTADDGGPTFDDFDPVVGTAQVLAPLVDIDTPLVLVLAHGFLSCAEKGFAPEIVTALRKQGHWVARTCVPAIESIAVRGQSLAPQITDVLAVAGAARAHVIAHSMGGLDTRYVIASLGLAGRIASLTTISTPHLGSPLADVLLSATSGLAERGLAKTALAKVLGVSADQVTNFNAALTDLSEAHAPVRNLALKVDPRVRYQSLAGFATLVNLPNFNGRDACTAQGDTKLVIPKNRAVLPAALSATFSIVGHGMRLLPHDGVVSVISATFENFMGCIPAAHTLETDATSSLLTGYASVDLYTSLATQLTQFN